MRSNLDTITSSSVVQFLSCQYSTFFRLAEFTTHCQIANVWHAEVWGFNVQHRWTFGKKQSISKNFY